MGRTVPGVRYTGLGIHLKVSDITASRLFYEETLGLIPARGAGTAEFRRSLPDFLTSKHEDGLPGSPDAWNSVTYRPSAHAELEIGDGHPAVASDVFKQILDGPKVSAMLHVESLLPLVRDSGVQPTYPVRIYPWGSVEVVLRDPDGFVVVLIAPASDEEIAMLQAVVPVEDSREASHDPR
jgi:catechol 2,3-dioxygenase-like lactoylglutathione lyase family enzyme